MYTIVYMVSYVGPIPLCTRVFIFRAALSTVDYAYTKSGIKQITDLKLVKHESF